MPLTLRMGRSNLGCAAGRAWSLGFAALLAACTPPSGSGDLAVDPSATTTAGRGANDGTAPTGPANGTADVATPTTPPPACDAAETEAIQQALERAYAADVDAAASVKTACGVRFFSRGPGHVGPHDLHRIGSVTKTYVGALMLTLEKEGLLHLEDTVASWISGVPNGEAITIRQLLRHQSGIFSIDGDAEVWPITVPRTWTPEELLAVVRRHPPSFAPGTSWEYSNTNYIVAGMIAEKAAGKPIAQLIRSRILEPLGLRETFLASNEPLTGHTLARGLDAQGVDVTNLTDMTWCWAAGAMAATPNDVVEWIHRLGSGALLGPAAQGELLDTVPADPAIVGDSNDGLGVFVTTDPSAGTMIFHSGGLNGYVTLAVHFLDKHASVAAVVDHEGLDPNAGVAAITEVLFP